MARTQTRQDDERDLFMLEKYSKGVAYPQIARQTDTPPNTVGYRIRAIIQHDVKYDPDNAIPYWRD